MPHFAAFHQGLHCLLRQKQSSKKEIQYFGEIITCDPLIYTVENSDFILCSFIAKFLLAERVNYIVFKAAKSVTLDLIFFRNNVYNFQEHSNIAKIRVYILHFTSLVNHNKFSLSKQQHL